LSNKGLLLVITAPSGTGKTTIYRKLMDKRADLSFCVSCTTRKKRKREREGIDYRFIDSDRFMEKVKGGDFIEWAEVHGELYGTDKKAFTECVQSGRVCIFDLDVQGALNFIKVFPETVTVFIQPPSIDSLRDRLLKRGTEDDSSIKRRLDSAKKELEKRDAFQYIVVNNRVDEAIDEIERIIAEELKKKRG
jgi:guanylate kinase